MTTQSHSIEDEEESLKLVEDFNDELANALNSLGGKKPAALVDTYRFWSAKHVQRAVGGFAVLRRLSLIREPKLADSSKFLVRPAIEMAFRLQAVRLDPEMFYRIAHEELRQDKRLVQGQPGLQEESDKNWEIFKAAFAKDYPTTHCSLALINWRRSVRLSSRGFRLVPGSQAISSNDRRGISALPITRRAIVLLPAPAFPRRTSLIC